MVGSISLMRIYEEVHLFVKKKSAIYYGSVEYLYVDLRVIMCCFVDIEIQQVSQAWCCMDCAPIPAQATTFKHIYL